MRNETNGDPVYDYEVPWMPGIVCTECGAVVHAHYLQVHTEWHRLLWDEA